jgi:hypothetical protein
MEFTMAQTHRYVFGRFTISDNLFIDDRRAHTLEGFATRNVVEHHPYGWAFSGVVTMHEDPELNVAGTFITGFLSKYRPEGAVKLFDQESHEDREAQFENQFIAKAPFFLHVESGLIAYHPIPNLIDAGPFRTHLVEVFQAAFEEIPTIATIESVTDEQEFMAALREFDEIESISFHLHPSNPNNRDLWAETDNRLHSLEVAQYKEEYDLKEKASVEAIANDPKIISNAAMAADGYGNARATGKKNKRRKTVNTKNSPVEANVPVTTTENRGILSTLASTFEEILDRIPKRK